MKEPLSILLIFFLGNTLFLYSQEKNLCKATNALPKKSVRTGIAPNNKHPENSIATFKYDIILGIKKIDFNIYNQL